MTLNDIKVILESLKECKPAVEDFSWGPSLDIAEQRRKSALKILKQSIKEYSEIKE